MSDLTKNNRLKMYARELLLHCMRDYSEYHWCAGWLNNLEHDLWAFACGDVETMWAGSFGKGLQDDDRKRLLELANDAGGWYYWSDKTPVGERFISMDDWLKMYEEYKNDQA